MSEPYQGSCYDAKAWDRKLVERRAERDRQMEQSKIKLAELHGVPRDHRFERCYDIAWKFGHIGGFCEVEYFFGKMVELIKP